MHDTKYRRISSKNNFIDKHLDLNEKINHPNNLMKEYNNKKDELTDNINIAKNSNSSLVERKNKEEYYNSNELTSSLDNNNFLFSKLTSKYY